MVARNYVGELHERYPVDLFARVAEHRQSSVLMMANMEAALAENASAEASPDGNDGWSRSIQTVLNHAVNDAQDLIDDCLDGRGRPAARAARSLIEHLANFGDVSASTATARRYMLHKYASEDVLAASAPGIDLFRGKSLRRAKQRYARARREAEGNLPPLVEEFGSSYRRTWTEGNLRGRLKRLDYGRWYLRYQYLSSVVHGAGGGVLGTSRALDHDARQYRFGPDLALTSLAWGTGLAVWKDILLLAQRSIAPLNAPELVAACENLYLLWPRLHSLWEELDESLWRSAPPAPVLAVLALYPTGERWYLHSIESDEMWSAEPPEEKYRERVDQARARMTELSLRVSEDRSSRPVTCGVLRVTVRPRTGAKAFSPQAILPSGVDDFV
ncbi:DUF5677 domain-containing protein [uncultured Pseudokineococcus sp.]|uniref:DUF5677 domain-containing protein n=1 Tax=uncultured Pseudokineococcus sp. TaxID=1642928 RepID=UPI002633A156|nr:DUF5677 domain-containing protein [uncultured Pseudokineococcus sp.]